MNLKQKSLFNLIEIFRSNRKRAINSLNPKTHCEQKQMHDYYCDSEKPHVNNFSNN